MVTMRAYRSLLFMLILFLALSGISPAIAQDEPPPPETLAEVRSLTDHVEDQLAKDYGPATTGQETVELASTASGCVPAVVSRDPATAGPISVNSQFLVVSTSFCDETNSALIDLGSKWWGLSGKTQRIWGFVAVRDSDDVLLDIIPFDVNNDPLIAGALNVHLNWIAPYGKKVYRFELEANLRMLPDNVGPGTFKSTWYYQARPFYIYAPILIKSGQENCDVQLHIQGERGTNEYYCFSPQGNAFAMLHFGHSEKVLVEWVGKDHVRLGALPDSGTVFRLTWWDGYKDFHTPETTLQATLWPKNGGPPWLATEHMISGQFTGPDGTLWRVSVPMIWDP